MGAVPALDESGQPIFIYMGDVPHDKWIQSPWPRVVSWVVVSALSIFAALVGAILQEKWFTIEMFILTFVSILVIRWLISASPKLFFLSRARGDL